MIMIPSNLGGLGASCHGCFQRGVLSDRVTGNVGPRPRALSTVHSDPTLVRKSVAALSTLLLLVGCLP